MAANRRRRAAGFTLPLTMALAFSLMTLASGIVGLVVVSDRQAKAAATDLVTRVALESATEQALFDVEHEGEPVAAEWTAQESYDGLDVTVTLAPTRYKPDVNKTDPALIVAAIADKDLSQRVNAAMTPAKPEDVRPEFKRFGDFVRAVGGDTDAAEEDCLRRRLTLGRPKGDVDPAPPNTALIPPKAGLDISELIDIRAETRDGAGRRTVLWRRVRYSGKPDRLWLTHDWRLMRLPRQDIDCPPPAPPSILGPDLFGGNTVGGNATAP
jgi:hypothetical protein